MKMLVFLGIYSIGLFIIAVYREYKKYKDSQYTFFNLKEMEVYAITYWPLSIILAIIFKVLEKPLIFLFKIPKSVAHFLIRNNIFGDRDG